MHAQFFCVNIQQDIAAYPALFAVGYWEVTVCNHRKIWQRAVLHHIHHIGHAALLVAAHEDA